MWLQAYHSWESLQELTGSKSDTSSDEGLMFINEKYKFINDCIKSFFFFLQETR
jgi:hypothetical protein